MYNKIGRFEILSDLSRSDISSVYKADDTESGKTVALKTIELQSLGEQRPAMVKRLLEEAEASKVLNSHNIAFLFGAEEMEGKLCASMEYVQGNSVATMLARKEGFSIWDLQDIARQACQGFDHAHTKKVFHYSLEPAKIMVQWDGIVKILSFGVSGMGSQVAQAAGAAPASLHYMSPEQLRGETVDARSNLFSLGSILYEMVTERKAFDGENADQVRQAILESTPVAVVELNRKIHPALSAVIMKSLAKAPEERYQSGQELVNDLEKCKENPAKTTLGAKTAVAKVPTPAPKPPAPAPKAAPAGFTAATPTPKPAQPAAKAAAAAAGRVGAGTASWPANKAVSPAAPTGAKPAAEATLSFQEQMSAAVEEPEVVAPKINVDPMMEEGRQAGTQGPSFSDITELPPLKEVYVAPPPPPPVQEIKPEPVATMHQEEEEKPKAPRAEIAKKAVAEIKKTPPQLYMYAVAGAVVIMLLVVLGIFYHMRSEDTDDDNPTAQTETAPASTPAPATSAPPATQAAAPAPTPEQVTPPPAEATPEVSVTPKETKASKSASKKKVKTPPAAPAIIAGQLSIDSNPQGAQVQLDGNASGVTPFNMASLTPGQHTVVISKPGYSTETRSVNVASGGRSALSIQLAQLAAAVAANSTPSGAEVWIDGKDSGRTTPAQITLSKPGNHTFVFKKDGYLDETASANLQTGQTMQIAPTLRALGNTDEIHYGGHFKKVFGGGDTAGMGTVSVKTTPKGAQIAVNNRLLDKMSPVDFYLNPGNYVIDITMSGFKTIEKVVTVEKNGKVVIDESLDRQ
jgi:serine/threonine-protein kinase